MYPTWLEIKTLSHGPFDLKLGSGDLVSERFIDRLLSDYPARQTIQLIVVLDHYSEDLTWRLILEYLVELELVHVLLQDVADCRNPASALFHGRVALRVKLFD